MSRNLKRTVFFLVVLTAIPIATYIASRYARGERFDVKTKRLTSTGMLVATSVPDGAALYLDAKLKTATDDTINLVPGEYFVELKKDGYYPWAKTIRIEEEMVQKTEATLFSTFPSLQSLTFTGAERPVIAPNEQRVVFAVATGSAEKKGLWVLDLSNRPLGLAREPRQLVTDTATRAFSAATYLWSPDGKEILLTLEAPNRRTENFILDPERTLANNELIDITPNLPTIITEWTTEATLRQEEQLAKLPAILRDFLVANTNHVTFSPDMKKIVYVGQKKATLNPVAANPLPASTIQPDDRTIEPDVIYVYDLLEDRNFRLLAAPQDFLDDEPKTELEALIQPSPVAWLYTSRHLFLVRENRATVVEYDSTNWTDVYTGPMEDDFAFPFPTGDKLVILATLGENQPSNLYAVTIR